jgi:hypothetical protein
MPRRRAGPLGGTHQARTDGRSVTVAAWGAPDTGPQTLRRRLPLLLQARFRHLVVADVEPAETPTVFPDVLGIALALRWVR